MNGESCRYLIGPAKKYCNKDDTKKPVEDPCADLTSAAHDQCVAKTSGKVNIGGGDKNVFDIGKPNGVKPPDGDPADINDRPVLSRHNASGAGATAEPIKILLGYLKWTVLLACEVGIVLVGARAAIKHKRSEAGAHASGLTWVMIACVVAGSGLALAFINLVIDPL
ncbi:integral membrane protein [Actinomadura verrucosospora]|uniref:Integral membrane protein n=2 Tax=Actinomadura verrucosospora TaxID=46165 RepID=A0A7D3VV35_ACTVE|nr:integral membrane protein [Actinomadura verrucosospora]